MPRGVALGVGRIVSVGRDRQAVPGQVALGLPLGGRVCVRIGLAAQDQTQWRILQLRELQDHLSDLGRVTEGDRTCEARLAPTAAGDAPDGEAQHHDDHHRQQPPDGHPVVGEDERQEQGQGHRNGNPPVVTDHEVPEEHQERT
jgi:hypothetical protein